MKIGENTYNIFTSTGGSNLGSFLDTCGTDEISPGKESFAACASCVDKGECCHFRNLLVKFCAKNFFFVN